MTSTKEQKAASYARHRETTRKKQNAHRVANAEFYRARARGYYLKHRAKRIAAVLSKSGIPTPTRPCPERCEVCDRPPGKRALCRDHCHVQQKFRGWLCHRCNVALGMLGDTLQVARRLVTYMENAL